MSSVSSNTDRSIATGEFSVKIGAPAVIQLPTDASPIGRHTIEKEYQGHLQGSAFGEMLSAGQPQAGEAAYVAIESFFGTLDGRTGGFALSHSGRMHAGGETLHISVVPGPGTGELAGIQGELAIQRESGKHRYTFSYRINCSE